MKPCFFEWRCTGEACRHGWLADCSGSRGCLLAEASAGLMHAAVAAQVRARVPASIISGLLGRRIDCLLRPRITRSKMDARIASSLLAILLFAVLGKGRRVLPIFVSARPADRLLTESNDSSTPVSLAVSPASPSARIRC